MKIKYLMQAFLMLILILGALILSIYANNQLGFYSEFENEIYLPFYLSNKTVIQKVFDYWDNDSDHLYRPREVSNLFNILDTEIILIGFQTGYPHFLSGVYYISLLLIVFVQIVLAYRFFGRKYIWITLLMSLIFISSSTMFLSGWYFRPAKILVGLFLSFYSFIFLFVIKKNKFSNWTGYFISFITFIALLSMGLSDEIGMAMAGMLFIISLVVYYFHRRKLILSLVMGNIIGVVFLGYYRYIIGPFLGYLATGEYPVTWWKYGSYRPIEAINLAFQALFSYLQILCGNPPFNLGVISFVVVWLVLFLIILNQINGKPRYQQIIMSIFISLLMIFAISIMFIGMLFFMVEASTFVYPYGSVAKLYYPVPFITFLYILLHLMFLILTRNYYRYRILILSVLVFMLIGNCIALPQKISGLTDSSINVGFYYYKTTPNIINAIEHPGFSTNDNYVPAINTVTTLRNKIPGK